MRKMLFCVALCISCLHGANAQSFDVASIHAQRPDDRQFFVRPPANGRFTAQGVTAKLLVMLAYSVQEDQILGGPRWLSTEKWDLEARADDGGRYSGEESRRMLQDLLQDRFSLRFHRDTAQRAVYALTLTKDGPKFKPSTRERTNIRVTPKSFDIQRGNVAAITGVLASALGRPVIDRTGLAGVYDLSLQWDDASISEGGVFRRELPASAPDHGSVFTAIQEQLGLRLDSQRAPIELIVIDMCEKPTAN
jgi:uncharacterized protein (TIGR03435 family)